MANIQLYPTGGAQAWYVLDANPQTQMLRGALKEQDITPTFKQSEEGAAGATDTQPTAEVVWSDLSGSIGLYKQSVAAGDLTRSYLSDADTTRPNQMTAWLQWPHSGTVTIGADNLGKHPVAINAVVAAPAGIGFTAMCSDLSHKSYWRWASGSPGSFAWQRVVQNTPIITTSARLPAPSDVYNNGGAGGYPAPVVVPTQTSLWSPSSVQGLADVSVAAAPEVGVHHTLWTFVYFDILFAISQSGPGPFSGTTGDLLITPYRPNTPGTGNVLQSVTYSGLAPALATLPGETVCLGAVACEGAVYIVTDRSVYAMSWNDNTNTMLTTKLLELPRLTSPPCVWNGEVYIGADNRIVHITPGQRGYDWRLPDPYGVMPPPFSGTVVALVACADALAVQVVDTAGAASSTGWAILRMDTQGAWSCCYLDNSSAGVARLPAGPPLPVASGGDPFALAVPIWNPNADGAGVGAYDTATLVTLPASGRNPRTLATTQRAQRPGPFRTVLPWYDLSSETAQKIMERLRAAVLDVTNALPIKVYYQTDYADEFSGADTFTSGAAKGTGTWHQCAQVVPSGAAGTNYFAGGTDAAGRGVAWYEFDNATTYTTVGKLPLYPTNKQVRFCIEISGDATGAKVPTFASLAYQRIEFVTKAYQTELSLRLRIGDDQGKAQGTGGGTVTYANAAAIVAAKNAIRAMVGGKTPCTYVDESGTSRTVLVTKYIASLLSVGADGNPGEYAITLTVEDIVLQGQN